MKIKEAIKNVTTEMYLITRNGEILCINGLVGGEYDENETVKSIDIINNVCDGSPVTTAIRV